MEKMLLEVYVIRQLTGILFLLYFAVIDVKTKTIPDKPLAVMIITAIAISTLSSMIYYDSGLWISIICAFFVTAVLGLIASYFSKEQIGLGDVKLLATVGLYSGILGIFNILFYSLLLAMFFSVFLILFRHADKKKEIPFAPFIFLGYVIYFLLILNV